MKAVDKLLTGYALCALAVFIGIGYRSYDHCPFFLKSKAEPIVYAHGITFYKDGSEPFKELHTAKRNPLGFHQMKSTLLSRNSEKIFKKTYAVYFWTDTVFSAELIDKDEDYTSDQESDVTEAHLIEYPQQEFFQAVYQDNELFCYTSLLTDSVQCVKLIMSRSI